MYRPIDNIENGMVLYDERDYWKDEDEYAYEDYLADEADRRWKDIIELAKDYGIKEEELK